MRPKTFEFSLEFSLFELLNMDIYYKVNTLVNTNDRSDAVIIINRKSLGSALCVICARTVLCSASQVKTADGMQATACMLL